MSIIIQHQREKISQLQSQIAYLENDVLPNKLEAWERKEYETVLADYKSELAATEAAIAQAS